MVTPCSPSRPAVTILALAAVVTLGVASADRQVEVVDATQQVVVSPGEAGGTPATTRVGEAGGTPATTRAPEQPPTIPTPSLADAAEEAIEKQVLLLAGEMGRMYTQEPEALVRVIERASRSATTSPPVTFLLAIAHAETHGKILEVSEAAAVGLAQATPVAYLLEGYEGKLYLTEDYFRGVSAYIMKKPLADADAIATRMLDRNKPLTRQRAARLHQAAVDLRREGLEELEVLRGHAPESFFAGLEKADRRNEAALRELEILIRSNDRVRLTEYRDRIRKEYRDLRTIQRESWKRYQQSLIARRDAIVVEHFGIPADEVKAKHRYEAGTVLARRLDERFSPELMAEFLVRHLARKAAEAETLEPDSARLEQMTAALYNGGALNVKRMKAGLITSLPETEKYSVKVPSTHRRLQRTLEESR